MWRTIALGKLLPCAIFVALLLSQGSSSPSLANDQTIGSTQNGAVQGFIEDGILKFLGIPYAKPPVGELRWANPQPADSWTEVRDATEFGNACAQLKFLGDFADASNTEDCLYLNVFTPKKGTSAKLPVMVWIHGGGLFVGQSNGHDGSALAKEQNVVVVSINYRLGRFGFFVHPSLDGGGATTNYALRDQQLALQWVQDNIENFGGDPDNVTIFGESAGGLSVVLQVMSPTAAGLFHKAIVESGAYQFWSPLRSLAEGETLGEVFAANIGCPDQTAECLRSLPVETILGGGISTVYVNDGHTLTIGSRDAFLTGQFNHVPIFNGSNHDESRWFIARSEINGAPPITADEYPAQLAARFGADAPAVEQAYPLSDFDSPSGALSAAVGDEGFICPARNLNLAASSYVNAYGYEFNDPDSPENVFPPVSFPYLAAHTHEIQYIFPGWKGVSPNPGIALTKEQEKLAKEMRKAWATFAKKGAPQSNWPLFEEGNELMMSLEVPDLQVISDFASDHKCALWDSLR